MFYLVVRFARSTVSIQFRVRCWPAIQGSLLRPAAFTKFVEVVMARRYWFILSAYGNHALREKLQQRSFWTAGQKLIFLRRMAAITNGGQERSSFRDLILPQIPMQ
jgi:hypothetical protein